MDDFHADDFHTAAQRAIQDVAGCADPDGEPVHVALTLALYAWTHGDPPPGRAGTGWAMFGNGLCAARDELPAPPPLVVLGDEAPLADTRQLREDAAALVTTVAGLLASAAADPHADPGLSRAWSKAARRLCTAAADLIG